MQVEASASSWLKSSGYSRSRASEYCNHIISSSSSVVIYLSIVSQSFDLMLRRHCRLHLLCLVGHLWLYIWILARRIRVHVLLVSGGVHLVRDARLPLKLQDCDDRGSFLHRLSSVDPLNYRFSPFHTIFAASIGSQSRMRR